MREPNRNVIRAAQAADYDAMAAVIDDWWARPVLPGLPRLFLDHFHRTSLVAERDGELVGFLVGIVSPSQPEEAYIITSPANEASVAFHRRLGFTVTGPVRDYNGPGRDRITFERTI